MGTWEPVLMGLTSAFRFDLMHPGMMQELQARLGRPKPQ